MRESLSYSNRLGSLYATGIAVVACVLAICVACPGRALASPGSLAWEVSSVAHPTNFSVERQLYVRHG